jgi:predicted DsbA family dithiol-disulfide isomerase
VQVRYTYFPLHPDTPPEGRSLRDLFAGRGEILDDMQRRLRALMASEGLTYGERTRTYNSRLAQELAVAADEVGATDAMHDALFHAYFIEARNLASPEVLWDIGSSVGLDAALTRSVIEDRINQDAVDAHWSRARAMGITGVPTFVAGGFGVVGAQPYEMLERLVERAAHEAG